MLVLLAAAQCACVSAPEAFDLIVDDVILYDGQASRPVRATVCVRDGRFVSIALPGARAIDAPHRIAGRGLYLVPGLWDMHVHLRSSEDGGLQTRTFLDHGVTGVRDLGGMLPRVQALQRDLAAGRDQGPHVYAALTMLNGESFAPFQKKVSSEAEIAGAIDALAAGGAAHIKTHNALDPALLSAVVKHARRHGLSTIAHGPRHVHPLEVCRAGVAGLEHVGALVEGIFTADPDAENPDAAIEELLSDASTPLMDCLRRRGIAVTPTLVIYPHIARRRAGDGPLPDAFVRFITDMQRIALRLHEAGVTLLAGTDTSDFTESPSLAPGEALHRELAMLEDAGIAPLDVLRIATANGARAVGEAGRLGTVEVGKDADFLLLYADPGETVRNLRSIVGVFQGGRQVSGNANLPTHRRPDAAWPAPPTTEKE